MPPLSDEQPDGQRKRFLESLRKTLIARFGKPEGEELYEAVLRSSEALLGKDFGITAATIQILDRNLDTLLNAGTFGIGAKRLVHFDNVAGKENLRHEKNLQLLRHYLMPDDFRAILASYTLVRILSDPAEERGATRGELSTLYEQLKGTPRGWSIYKLVSTGRLDDNILSEMWALEKKLSPAGRLKPKSGEAEMVRQVFYGAIKPDPTKMWLGSTTTIADAVDAIYDSLVDKPRNVGYLDVYGTRQAWETAQNAAQMFVRSFPGFDQEPHPQQGNSVAGFVRIRKLAFSGGTS